jgi:hypothetical protein
VICVHMCRVGQNHIYAPHMTVYLVISLPKIPCIHRIYMLMANPTYVHDTRFAVWLRWRGQEQGCAPWQLPRADPDHLPAKQNAVEGVFSN